MDKNTIEPPRLIAIEKKPCIFALVQRTHFYTYHVATSIVGRYFADFSEPQKLIRYF